MNFDHPPTDPLDAFNQWFKDAQATDLPNPNSMTLATIDPDGKPSARIVLLKGADANGLVFYTNRNSRKGKSLAANPIAALVFHWDVLNRQVRVEGSVTLTSDEESDVYFATRPRGSQIGAWASKQSEPVTGTEARPSDRAELDRAFAEIEKRFEGKPVPRPPHWGGYVLTPQSWEFWQGHPHRLHDRLLYVAEGKGGWSATRLYP